jgi:hypothetical protein
MLKNTSIFFIMALLFMMVGSYLTLICASFVTVNTNYLNIFNILDFGPEIRFLLLFSFLISIGISIPFSISFIHNLNKPKPTVSKAELKKLMSQGNNYA